MPAGLCRTELPASLAGLAVVVLDGKKIKKAAKRLLATRGRPGTLFGGKILVAYLPAEGLVVALAADPDGEANDIRLVPRVLPLARAAIAGPRLWVADRQFCDLEQPRRFSEGDDHYLIVSVRCRDALRGRVESGLSHPRGGPADAEDRPTQSWGPVLA